MKRSLVTFLTVLGLCTNLYSNSEIKDGEVRIEKEKFNISISRNSDETFRVTVLRNGAQFKYSKFFLNLEKDNSKAFSKENVGIINDGFIIKETESGFNIIKDGKELYNSSFAIENNSITQTIKCNDSELLYGMGEANDKFALANKSFTISNKSEYGNQAKLYIPFIFSLGGDSFYFNSSNNDIIKFGKKDDSLITISTEKDYIDFYYYFEKEPKKIVQKFIKMTDSRSMIPKWAFGYIQSKYGYESQNELIKIVEQFKKEKIPVSAVVLDLQWFDKMGDWDWNLKKWPNPKELDDFLEKSGVKLITISEPFFTCDSKNYKYFEENGLLGKYSDGKTMNWGDWWCFGSAYGSIMNPIAPKAFEIIGQKYIDMMNTGIDAFWTDLGEPENTDSRTMFNEYTEGELHNYYNREWSKLVYNAIKKEFPDKRLMILSRSGFTGSPKYGVSIWSGDSSSTFLGLRKQAVMGINSGITGFSYWGSDVGGFVSNERLPNEELFVRWMQFGAFTPVFRAHGAKSGREPWIYPGKSQEIITKYINLRYEMMPYIYSTAYQSYNENIPMMRPMIFEYPMDKEAQNIGDQYFFGDYLLVAPVLYPIDMEKEKSVYIPDDGYYDFYNFEKQKKGNLKLKSEIEKIPLYIKSGAIIPFDIEGEALVMLLPYDNIKSTHVWYNDDGVTNNFDKGEFEAINIELSNDSVEFKNVKIEKEVTLKILKEKIRIKELKEFRDEGKFIFVKTKLLKGDNKIQF